MLCRVRLACPPPEAPIVVEAVYKPTAGERPLDDFPDGTLSHREVAAFLVSEAMGWAIVPPTIRRDGPFGDGSLQLWIDSTRPSTSWRWSSRTTARLRRIAVFDAAVNNTDRKGGHLLPVPGGHVYGVDHGVTFSTVPKLRTVLWGWRGRPFAAGRAGRPGAARATRCAATSLATSRACCRGREIAATRRRVDGLLETRRFPQPRPDWPAIPWPPF